MGPQTPHFSGFLEPPRTPSYTSSTKIVESKEDEASRSSSNKVEIPITTTNSGNSTNKGNRRLSEAEVNRRRALGLCFKCEEKFGPNHKCKGKQFKMLIVTKDDEEDAEQLEGLEIEEDIPERVFTAMRITFTSIIGFTDKKTMKLEGRMKGKRVIVLVNSGATHNFISRQIVKEMGVIVQQTHTYSVTVGDDRKFYSRDVCPEVDIKLQSFRVKQTFYPFNLENVDMVLGIAWLESLGETRVHWGQLYMKVRVGKKWVCLRGDPTLTQTQVTYKAFRKAANVKGKAT